MPLLNRLYVYNYVQFHSLTENINQNQPILIFIKSKIWVLNIFTLSPVLIQVNYYIMLKTVLFSDPAAYDHDPEVFLIFSRLRNPFIYPS